MPRIKPPEKYQKKRKKIFGEIQGAFVMVSNLFRNCALHPPLLESNWNKVKAVMLQMVKNWT